MWKEHKHKQKINCGNFPLDIKQCNAIQINKKKNYNLAT